MILSALWGSSKKEAFCKPDTESVHTLILDSSASGPVRSKCVLYRPLTIGYFVMASHADAEAEEYKTFFYQNLTKVMQEGKSHPNFTHKHIRQNSKDKFLANWIQLYIKQFLSLSTVFSSTPSPFAVLWSVVPLSILFMLMILKTSVLFPVQTRGRVNFTMLNLDLLSNLKRKTESSWCPADSK